MPCSFELRHQGRNRGRQVQHRAQVLGNFNKTDFLRRDHPRRNCRMRLVYYAGRWEFGIIFGSDGCRLGPIPILGTMGQNISETDGAGRVGKKTENGGILVRCKAKQQYKALWWFTLSIQPWQWGRLKTLHTRSQSVRSWRPGFSDTTLKNDLEATESEYQTNIHAK